MAGHTRRKTGVVPNTLSMPGHPRGSRFRPIRNPVVDQFELPFFTMVALERGRAASPNRTPNGPSHRFSRLRPRDARRENICAYVLRRSEVSELSARISTGGGRPCPWKRAFSREVTTKGKAARSSPRRRIPRPFLQLNLAPTNPLKFQRRNPCAKFMNSDEATFS